MSVSHTAAVLPVHADAKPHGMVMNRRRVLKLAVAGVSTLLAATSPAAVLIPADRERLLSVYAPNTGEILRLAYWIPGEGYLSQSIREMSHFMRDHRTDQVKPIDPELLDMLYQLQRQLQPRQPIQILSGYRSPETNALLRQRSRNVAPNSWHMRAKAVDIRMPDRHLSDVHRAALALQAGGVGCYERSQFIHIDTGPLRRW